MGSTIYHLASNPDLQNELRIDNKLIIPFIEEVIRMSPPFKFHYRYVNQTVLSAAIKYRQVISSCLAGTRRIEMKN